MKIKAGKPIDQESAMKVWLMFFSIFFFTMDCTTGEITTNTQGEAEQVVKYLKELGFEDAHIAD